MGSMRDVKGVACGDKHRELSPKMQFLSALQSVYSYRSYQCRLPQQQAAVFSKKKEK